MEKIIKSQKEANYITHLHGGDYIETIFELVDGRFFKGERLILCKYTYGYKRSTQNEKTFRKSFLAWLKDPNRNQGLFEEGNDDFNYK